MILRLGEGRVRRGAACVDSSRDWKTALSGIERVLLLYTDLKYHASRLVVVRDCTVKIFVGWVVATHLSSMNSCACPYVAFVAELPSFSM
jgi:hypothetical protein